MPCCLTHSQEHFEQLALIFPDMMMASLWAIPLLHPTVGRGFCGTRVGRLEAVMLTVLCGLTALSLLEYKKRIQEMLCRKKGRSCRGGLFIVGSSSLGRAVSQRGNISSFHCLSQQIFIVCLHWLLWIEVGLFVCLATFWEKMVSKQVKLRIVFVLFSSGIQRGKPGRTYEVPRKVLCMKWHWEDM